MRIRRCLPGTLLALLTAAGLVTRVCLLDSTHAARAETDGAAGRFIVVFKPTVGDPDRTAADLAHAHGIAVEHVYQSAIKGLAGVIPAARLRALALDPRVRFIERDQEVYTFAQTVPTGIRRIETDRSPTARINGLDYPDEPEGRVNIDVAIIDTGIQTNHPDLNVQGGRNFTSKNLNDWGDDNGHGTHVAGIVAAKDNNIGVVGVAPGARLWAVKVLSRNGSGMMSWILKGIDWVTQNAGTIKVANMSLGGGNSPALLDAIASSVAAGVTYVVAAGNEAQDCANTSPANSTSPGVITVSALADADGIYGGAGGDTGYGPDDHLATFSNFGTGEDGVDVIAPGVKIYSTYKNSGYATLSGTSMASPHVAGVAALYKAKNPWASPAEVKTATVGSASGASAIPSLWGCLGGDPDGVYEPLVCAGAF